MCQHIVTTVSPMKTKLIQIRVRPSEKDGFQAAADLSGLALSAWMRERLRRAAAKELQAASRPIAFLDEVDKK
jgi:uncharacterized protein (DUF1778 family)